MHSDSGEMVMKYFVDVDGDKLTPGNVVVVLFLFQQVHADDDDDGDDFDVDYDDEIN